MTNPNPPHLFPVPDLGAEGDGPTNAQLAQGFAALASPSADGHDALSEYHSYAAIAVTCGEAAAEAETGAALPVHAARLAAALGELLAENAVLRVIASAAIL